MYFVSYFILLMLLSSVVTRHVPRVLELDDEEQHLFRAAYESPTYEHDDYQYQEEDDLGKLDLLKDGMWAIKAKIKELKAFDKALAANLLSTKLKLKELLKSNVLATIKEHHHDKKPSYSYQAPYHHDSYPAPPPPPQYSAPQYQPAAPQYGHDPYYGH